jgi:hypothetical protein
MILHLLPILATTRLCNKHTATEENPALPWRVEGVGKMSTLYHITCRPKPPGDILLTSHLEKMNGFDGCLETTSIPPRESYRLKHWHIINLCFAHASDQSSQVWPSWNLERIHNGDAGWLIRRERQKPPPQAWCSLSHGGRGGSHTKAPPSFPIPGLIWFVSWFAHWSPASHWSYCISNRARHTVDAQ